MTTSSPKARTKSRPASRAGLEVYLRFDPETAALIQQACATFHRRHLDMNPTQLARDGARRWAAQILSEEHQLTLTP